MQSLVGVIADNYSRFHRGQQPIESLGRCIDYNVASLKLSQSKLCPKLLNDTLRLDVHAQRTIGNVIDTRSVSDAVQPFGHQAGRAASGKLTQTPSDHR